MDSRAHDVLVAMSPGLILAAVLVLSFLLYLAVGTPGFKESASRRHGSMVVPVIYVQYFYWLTDPVARGLGRLGIRPNHVTLFSLLLAGATAVALAMGHFMIGFWLFFAAIACDLIDGVVARSQNSGSQAGAFLDSWIDRAAEGVVLIGLAIYGRDTILLELSLWALVASFLVSYSRARGVALGVDCKGGLMQRPERMFVLCWAIFLSPLVALWMEPRAEVPIFHAAILGVGILAFLSTITAINRLRWTMKLLNEESDIPEPKAAPANGLAEAEAR